MENSVVWRIQVYLNKSEKYFKVKFPVRPITGDILQIENDNFDSLKVVKVLIPKINIDETTDYPTLVCEPVFKYGCN